MTLTNSRMITKVTMNGLTAPVGDLPGNANKLVAVPMIVDGQGETGALAYSSAAEDNGTTGNLDDLAGLIYTGTPGGYVNVEVYDLDVRASIAPLATFPEATDTVSAGLFINSTLVGTFDEGAVAELDTGTAEFNTNQVVGPLFSGDVVRIGLTTVGEADADLNLPTAGDLRITS